MTPDNSMNIDIGAKINADFTPLIQATPKGIGRVLSCLLGRREAENLRDTILMAAKTQVEYQMILSGEYTYNDGKIVPSPYFNSIETANPLQVEKRQELENLAGNIGVAIESLRNIPDEEISDKEVDSDFFARWRREAKVIGNEEVQRLWGRLLAEEISQPESISLRTLDTVKNISTKEASLFRKACSGVVGGKHLVTSRDFSLIPGGLRLDDLLVLNSAGLIVFPDQNTHTRWPTRIDSDGKQKAFIGAKDAILILDAASEALAIPGVSLTSVGREIYKICDHTNPGNAEFDFVLCEIQKQNNNLITHAVAVVTQILDGRPVDVPLPWKYTFGQ